MSPRVHCSLSIHCWYALAVDDDDNFEIVLASVNSHSSTCESSRKHDGSKGLCTSPSAMPVHEFEIGFGATFLDFRLNKLAHSGINGFCRNGRLVSPAASAHTDVNMSPHKDGIWKCVGVCCAISPCYTRFPSVTEI